MSRNDGSTQDRATRHWANGALLLSSSGTVLAILWVFQDWVMPGALATSVRTRSAITGWFIGAAIAGSVLGAMILVGELHGGRRKHILLMSLLAIGIGVGGPLILLGLLQMGVGSN